MSHIEVIPTVVPAHLRDIDHAQVRYGNFAPILHIDATDGMFAPSLTWMPAEGETLPTSNVLYEAHLMVHDPYQVGIAFARAGATRIIAHIEAFSSPAAVRGAFAAWKEAGAKEAGLAVLLDTPLHSIEDSLQFCDSVLLMTIPEIGKQGIPFDEKGIGRIAELHTHHPTVVIAVDGGVAEGNAKQLARAGASRLCVGSALAVAEHPAEVYVRIRMLAESGLAQ